MNIIINQKKLLDAVHTVERIVSKNISLPILGTILLKTEQGKLKLTATNLEIGIQYWVGAKIEKEGMVAVPARIFSEFIGSVKDEKLNISVDKNSIFISSEHYKTQILGMKTDEFPIIPTVAHGSEFTIPGVQLASALGKVFDATSLLETRPELSGVYISVTSKQITFAATDSFRLSEYILPVPSAMEKVFILPRTTALEVLRLSGGREEEFRVCVGENQISVKCSDVELVSRLVDGKYPDYKKVIPEHFSASLSVSKQELEQHVRMASIFSSNISDLSLKALSGTLSISAKNSDRGEISSQIPFQGKASFTIAVNYKYLLDALKVIDSDRVEIGYSGEGSPLVVRGEKDVRHTYVIMPLRA